MVFSIVILLLVIGIAYFHFVQGLLSGIISMVLAVLAASLAVGYHEAIVTGVLGGKMGDYANGVVLCVIFMLVYGIGRIVFDSFVPGNVRLPLYVDSIGGGVCGLVVGLFAAGMFALAIQSMPFGPTILTHSRYALAEDRDVTVQGARRQETAMVTGALEEDLPDESKANSLWTNADGVVVDFVAFQSESGALAGGTKLRDRHPNLQRELFLQRVGIENSAKRMAMNIGGRTDVEVKALFAPAGPMPQIDGENPSLARGRNLPKVVKQEPNKVTLVIRTTVAKSATDSDSNFRFSTGAIRLVANGKDFTPAGLLYEPGRTNLLLNYRADDYIIGAIDPAAGGVPLDLVFIVDREDVLADPAAKEDLKIRNGAFLEVKRLARVDLSEKSVAGTMPPPGPAAGGVLLKKELLDAIKDKDKPAQPTS